MSRGTGPVLGLGGAMVLAYVIGMRLSESTMAVVIGVIFGVAASIPAGLILTLAFQRATQRRDAEARELGPPTLLVMPPWGQPEHTPSWPQHLGEMYLPPLEDPQESGDRLRIIGGEG